MSHAEISDAYWSILRDGDHEVLNLSHAAVWHVQLAGYGRLSS